MGEAKDVADDHADQRQGRDPSLPLWLALGVGQLGVTPNDPTGSEVKARILPAPVRVLLWRFSQTWSSC